MVIVVGFLQYSFYFVYGKKTLKSPACGCLEGISMVPLCWDGTWTDRAALFLCSRKESDCTYDMQLGEDGERRGGGREEKGTVAYCYGSRVTSKHDRNFGKLLLTYQDSWMSNFSPMHCILQLCHSVTS